MVKAASENHRCTRAAKSSGASSICDDISQTKKTVTTLHSLCSVVK